MKKLTVAVLISALLAGCYDRPQVVYTQSPVGQAPVVVQPGYGGTTVVQQPGYSGGDVAAAAVLAGAAGLAAGAIIASSPTPRPGYTYDSGSRMYVQRETVNKTVNNTTIVNQAPQKPTVERNAFGARAPAVAPPTAPVAKPQEFKRQEAPKPAAAAASGGFKSQSQSTSKR